MRINQVAVTLLRCCLLSLCLLFLVCHSPAICQAQTKSKKAKPAPDEPVEMAIGEKWHVSYFNPNPRPGTLSLPAKLPFAVVDDLEISGPFPNDPFLLGTVKVDGEWGLVDGYLTRTAGRNAAIMLGTTDQFELEGKLNVEGLGGWFMLLGWGEGHGYAVYNVNLKTSGSPWHVCEFRGGEGIESTHKEVTRYECRGLEGFRMRVDQDMLNLQVETTKLIENYPLDNYHPGQVIIGTYDTKYGAKPLKIASLRIRSLPQE